ncbi:hypothetical protein [Desulfovibrio sp. TomC]|uniref:hypothetical protein n=1 Tax=Desulfovibrio sp. TomC TaxID=1562888 RepID=UPI0005755C8E|nr:hypothetical protein [Desulfovibrio sp. TomC]KHK02075.1 hypothetical protein NY78_2559 [Desulfovibrio sp. TomC]
MSRPLRLTTCLGLGASAAPQGLVCDPDTGRYELAEAVNVDVVAGRLMRRPGFERQSGHGFSGLFSDGANLYGVCCDGLYLIPGQGEPALLRPGLTPGASMAFVTVGSDVYFANGFETGRIRQGVAEAWAGQRYPGPDRIGRFGPPPVGHALAYHAGRIWIAVGNCVHFTEGAGLYDWVDGLGGFLPPFVGRIRMLAPVGGGLFVGDDAGVVHVAGTDPKKMTFARVDQAAPIVGSLALLSAGRHESVAGSSLDGDGAVWAAPDGIHLGLSGGRVRRIAAAAIPAPGRVAAAATRGRYLLFASH